jgi:hypothetical protein
MVVCPAIDVPAHEVAGAAAGAAYKPVIGGEEEGFITER